MPQACHGLEAFEQCPSSYAFTFGQPRSGMGFTLEEHCESFPTEPDWFRQKIIFSEICSLLMSVVWVQML